MQLRFNAHITAADNDSRTLTGLIVPFGKPGSTSVGPVVFEVGSITNLDDPASIKLLMEHDHTRPVGRFMEFTPTPTGIVGKAKVTSTQAGSDLLVEASEQLRDGFSVGVTVNKHDVRKGVMHVLDATLEEVSAVARPAFDDARIVDVAASEPDEATSTEGETVNPEDQDTTVEETQETVEASAAPVKATASPIYTSVRHGIKSPGNFVEHTLKAHLGDAESALWVKAASDGTTTEWAGLIPTPQFGPVINGKTTSIRPAVSAISTAALPASGMTFELPRVKTATTAAVVAQQGAFSDTQGEIEYLSVSVQKLAGMQLCDVEAIYRSTPAYFDELAMLMSDALAAAADDMVTSSLATNGTQDSTAITLPWDGDELSAFISRAASSIYSNTLRFPTGIIMTPTQWANMIALNDSSKRPLFNVAGSPQNPFGAVEPGSAAGNILGLPVYVDPHLGAADSDDSIIVVARDAYTFYEGPRYTLRADTVGTGKISIGYFGFAAVAPKLPAGAFRFNKA